MHRFSASISSLRGDKKATSPTLGQSGSSDASEFGSRNSNGLPPIPQEQRRGTQQQQQQQQQRRQSMQGSQQSSFDARRRSFAPSQSLNSPSASSSAPMQPQQARTVNSPTAGLHSLPAVAQLLNARKVYRAGYIWRLDGHPSSSPTGQLHPASSSATSPRLQDGNGQAQGRGPRFVRYYMRLEDCILCLWPDEGLREAQANGTVIHPTSMNLQDGFVVLADAKREWQNRAQQFSAPTPFMFVLNTAGK